MAGRRRYVEQLEEFQKQLPSSSLIAVDQNWKQNIFSSLEDLKINRRIMLQVGKLYKLWIEQNKKGCKIFVYLKVLLAKMYNF